MSRWVSSNSEGEEKGERRGYCPFTGEPLVGEEGLRSSSFCHLAGYPRWKMLTLRYRYDKVYDLQAASASRWIVCHVWEASIRYQDV
ncbi:hypothetical protein YC2023_005001 [Brassica napus]